ncbi:outer membrane lipoprotein carrier protein LolA [Pseudoxanthomonas wuyuanensis]
MKWVITGLLALALAFGAAAVRAADDLALVQQRVAQVPVLRGDFQQQKQVAGFSKPLRSQGRFVLSREHGVLWSTLKPFASEVVLTRDRILSRQRDGSTRVELDGRQQPALRAVNEMMFALMSGDVAALAPRFSSTVEALPEQGWRLTLTPQPGPLARSFKRIRLQGDRYVRQVEIEEANGDRSLLEFTAISESPAALSHAEAARFD